MQLNNNKFNDTVPFDPGYSEHVLDFSSNIKMLMNEVNRQKAQHQKKFKFSIAEKGLLQVLNNRVSFYLGCLLWASYIHYRYKEEPKTISGNTFLNMSDDEVNKYDFTEESEFLINYLTQFDRDCKYYLKRPAKLDKLSNIIALSYKEFLEINNNFLKTERTSDIKLPDVTSHFAAFTNEQLDKVYQLILNVTKSGNLEELLNVGFCEDI